MILLKEVREMPKKKGHKTHEHENVHVKKEEPPKQKKVGVNAAVKKTNLPKHKILGDAPQENCFILCNGKPVKNVHELADALGELGDYVFNHHVTPEKNDFANWVRDIFQDEELANQLATTNNLHDTRIIMYRHIISKLQNK
jgi:hypothetical protein